MATNSNRSSGTQHNQRGVTQGNTLVDPVSGLPIAVITDSNGNKRLAVDSSVTVNAGSLTVNLDGTGTNGDNVYIVDNATGNKLKINSDGSIDANILIEAANGDSALAVGTEDGTTTGTQHVLQVDSNKNLIVKDTAAEVSLASVDTKLDTVISSLNSMVSLLASAYALKDQYGQVLTDQYGNILTGF